MDAPVINKKYGTQNVLIWLVAQDPKLGKEGMEEQLLEKVEAYINTLDLSEEEYEIYFEDACARVLGY